MDTIKIDTNAVYVINPAYKIRNDIKRLKILNNNSLYSNSYNDTDEHTTSFSWVMHPNMAYIFSEFNGKKTLQEIIQYFSEVLSISEEEVLNSLKNYINNGEVIHTSPENRRSFGIPKKFLIEKEKEVKVNVILKDDIDSILKEGLDLFTIRNYIPDQITIMINNVCVVDCEYCYADRSVKVDNPLPFSRIKEIIANAAELGMRDVEIGGGEFFLYPHWAELLEELLGHEYVPYISTKYPLTKEMVSTLKDKGIKSVQLSIDTVDNEEIKKMLNVSDGYLDKVKKGMGYLNDAGIEIIIKSVITRYNDSTESVLNLLNYVKEFKMFKRLTIAPGDYSMYKQFNYHTTIQKMECIKSMVENIRDQYDFEINVQSYNAEPSSEEKGTSFSKRSICSGNVNGFYVLPDGKVTICEQMYWHPFFILGDLSQQSIMEVWNGEKALALWNFSQDEVREESPCKNCDQFEECRRGLGNCWRFAIAAYGKENYDYPTPDCPKAPPVTRPYYMPET